MAWTALVAPVTALISKFVPDKDKAAQLAHDITTLAENHAHDERMGQMAVNKQEAAHKSMFVAGWRPAVGWICAVGIGFNFVLQPLLIWVAFAFSADMSDLPKLEIADLMLLLGGMLGMGKLRSDEKKAGVARER